MVPRVRDALVAEFAYHEAGHAVMGWHNGWRFEVTQLCPDHPEHGGQTIGPEPDPASKAETISHLQIAAAGPIALQRLHRRCDDEDFLLALLQQAALSNPWHYVEP